MDLISTEIVASHFLSGHETVSISAGTSVKIETYPNGEEILDVIVPTGKVWSVRIIVEIDETDETGV